MRNEDSKTKELSIIIPYYKTYEYTKKLMSALEPQLNESVEVIIVDDGTGDDFSYITSEYVKVLYLPQNSGTASKPRNVGLDNAIGKYITFIDSDDNVTEDYIETLLNDIKEEYDYYVYRWFINDGDVFGIWHMEDMFYNWNVWSYMYKKDIIGDIRFNENRIAGEDLEWLKQVLKPEQKRKEQEKAIYRYNTENEKSISHLLAQGIIKALKNE